MLIEPLDRGDLEVEAVRDAADQILVKNLPAEPLSKLRGEFTASRAEFSADCDEIDLFFLHGWIVPPVSEIWRPVRLTQRGAGLRSMCTEQT